MISKDTVKILLNSFYGCSLERKMLNERYSEIINKIVDDLEVLEIIKSHKLLNYVIKNPKCAKMYNLSQEEIEKLEYIMKE